MLGLRPSIRKELLSRVDQYNTIDSVIGVANRFASQFPTEGRTNRSDDHVLATGGNPEEPGADWEVECNPALAGGGLQCYNCR